MHIMEDILTNMPDIPNLLCIALRLASLSPAFENNSINLQQTIIPHKTQTHPRNQEEEEEGEEKTTYNAYIHLAYQVQDNIHRQLSN